MAAWDNSHNLFLKFKLSTEHMLHKAGTRGTDMDRRRNWVQKNHLAVPDGHHSATPLTQKRARQTCIIYGTMWKSYSLLANLAWRLSTTVNMTITIEYTQCSL